MNNNTSQDVMPCVTDVSEEHAAYSSQVIDITFSETLVNFHKAMQCYILEDGIFLSIQLFFSIELCPQNFWYEVALLDS
jgi:hypothetical protein